MDPNSELLRFGPFELDPERLELRRAGLVLRLRPQPMRILLLLASRAGEVLTREEIHQAIWGEETFVDFEHGINSAIRRIRFVLGDHAETPRYVRTIPRRGYSFVAPVERLARPNEPVIAAPPRRRLDLRATGVAAALVIAVAAMVLLVAELRSAASSGVPGRVVAVMPFRWLGPAAPGLDARTFDEELAARIAALPPRAIRLRDAEPERAAPRADVVIDGTIRQVDGRIRVIVSAVDGASRTQLWSETIERVASRGDGIAIEVAHRTIGELARRFLPPPRYEPLLRTNAGPAARAHYANARAERQRVQGFDAARLKSLYEAAIREEPRFSEAWSGLAEIWGTQSINGPIEASAHAAAEARRCARRALALQPDNAEALSALGVLACQRDYDLAAAEELFRRATKADPGFVDAHINLATALAMRGQGDESIRAFTAARQLDPAALDLSQLHPTLYLHARRYDDARARYREILAIKPRSQPALWGILWTYAAQGQWGEAIAMARSLDAAEDLPPAPPTREGFSETLQRFMPAVARGDRELIFNDYFSAVFYAHAGERDLAFAMLERAVATQSPYVSYLRVDPRVDPLRGDARFRELVVRANLRPRAERLVARR